MKSFFLFFLFCLFTSLQAECPRSQQVMEYVRHHLSSSGVLCRSSNGFVFLKVDDDYIHKCIEILSLDGYEPPPYFGERYDTGAHISIIYPRELLHRDPFTISELGSTILFEITGCEVEENPRWPGLEKIWTLLIKCPHLSQLRKKYGFFKELEFHITIGLKKRLAA